MADPNPEPFSEQSRMRNRRDSLEYGIVEAPGYHTLASVMGTNPEYAIFRKFSSLNALNLMRLQAELLELEEEYKVELFRGEKNEKGVPLASSFKALHESSSNQKRLLESISVKLDVYSKSRFVDHA